MEHQSMHSGSEEGSAILEEVRRKEEELEKMVTGAREEAREIIVQAEKQVELEKEKSQRELGELSRKYRERAEAEAKELEQTVLAQAEVRARELKEKAAVKIKVAVERVVEEVLPKA